MIRKVIEKWRELWKASNNWLLAMDVDPLEDLHLGSGGLKR
jgi:hypothetical protein